MRDAPNSSKVDSSEFKQASGIKSLYIWLATLVAVWVCHFAVTPHIDAYFFSIIMYAGINITLAVSLNLVNGITGQFSMGHAGFMAVGAYVSAYITTKFLTGTDVEPDMWLQIGTFLGSTLLGGIVATAVGYIVGMPSLRLKGDYLAIVTLGFGEIIRVVLLNMNVVGGARGMPGIPQLSSFGIVYSVAVGTVFVVWRIIRSEKGRLLLAIREDEVAAESMGVNTTQGKVRAFAVAAFFAGIAGSLFAHQLQYINPPSFDFNRSFEIIIMVVLGGMGSLTGSIFAAIFLTSIREVLRMLQEYTHVDFRMIIYSLVLIIMMLSRPNGIFGSKELIDFFPKKRRTLRSPKGAANHA